MPFWPCYGELYVLRTQTHDGCWYIQANFWGQRFMLVCQMGCWCIVALIAWTIGKESPFLQAVNDFPQEQKDLRSVSMPTASWVFMRAAGFFCIEFPDRILILHSGSWNSLGLKVYSQLFLSPHLFASELVCVVLLFALLVWLFCLWCRAAGTEYAAPTASGQSGLMPRRKLMLCIPSKHNLQVLRKHGQGAPRGALHPSQLIFYHLFSLHNLPLPKFPCRQSSQRWYQLWNGKMMRAGWNNFDSSRDTTEKLPGHLRNCYQWPHGCSAETARHCWALGWHQECLLERHWTRDCSWQKWQGIVRRMHLNGDALGWQHLWRAPSHVPAKVRVFVFRKSVSLWAV